MVAISRGSQNCRPSAAQPVKFIRHSTDLDCNFGDPAACRWQNVRRLDSLDFHLFRKEDPTPFPMVQVHPGPSDVKIGDQLLFTGDRKKTERDAILVSWPIRCQNSTGLLTFTFGARRRVFCTRQLAAAACRFWIYNGARVEVLLMEDAWTNRSVGIQPSGDVRFLPEKPHVDCGTVTVNTECRVEIPPRDRPFRLAIRAYDISHPDGAFVMLDNIFYEAQLCKVAGRPKSAAIFLSTFATQKYFS